MLHTSRVCRAIYYATRRRLRILLRVKPRPRPPPVLGQSLDKVVERHGGIVRALIGNLPAQLRLCGASVCEVGPGDCLAAASFYLGSGATHADLVETAPPVVNEKQLAVLENLRRQGLSIDTTIIRKDGDDFQLDGKRVTHHACYMENFDAVNRYDLLSSFSVVEHVEDLNEFHRACWRALKPGGWALHIIDLGGHEQFEDPLPPLDFQTYPNWLYTLMYPRYFRATRRLFHEHQLAALQAGFTIQQVAVLRRADDRYLSGLWPRLRVAARARPREEVAVIEFALLLRREA